MWSKTMRQGDDMVFPVAHYHQSPSYQGSEQNKMAFVVLEMSPYNDAY